MIAIGTTETPSVTQSNACVSLNAFEILHVIHDTRTTDRRVAVRSRWVWISAAFVGALVCWQVIADHFALSREVDRDVLSMVAQLCRTASSTMRSTSPARPPF